MNSSNLYSIFSSGLFIYLALPLISAILGIFVKIVSQNDKFYQLKKEDFAIGLELSLVSIISLITHAVSLIGKSVSHNPTATGPLPVLDEKLVYFPWLLTLYIFGAWGVSTIVRKYGWENEHQMTWICGLTIPLMYGFISILLSLHWIAS